MEESLLMKSINRVFSFLFFVLLFACSASEPAAEEVIPENLTVSSFVLFSATEETRSINISSTLDWRVNNSLDWVTVSPTSGSNNGDINLTVTSNPTSAQREGVINLTGRSLSRTIQIRQPGTVQEITTPPSGGIDATRAPSENFDLSTWKLSIPVDEGDGTATDISVSRLNSGYENSSFFILLQMEEWCLNAQ